MADSQEGWDLIGAKGIFGAPGARYVVASEKARIAYLRADLGILPGE